VLVPRYSEPGTWVLDEVAIWDALGNHRYLDLIDLLELGVLVTFDVEGTGDVTPPQALDLHFSPTLVDAFDGPRTIAVTVQLTDDLSGVNASFASIYSSLSYGGQSATFYSPSRSQSATVRFDPFTRQSGDAWNGVYMGQMLVPEGSEAGTWTLAALEVSDVLGNSERLELVDFVARGWPVHFTNAPALTLAKSGSLLAFTWPTNASGFTLQSNASLQPAAVWIDVSPAPTVVNGVLRVDVSMPDRPTFFRLRRTAP
jgi:hypothetical protein